MTTHSRFPEFALQSLRTGETGLCSCRIICPLSRIQHPDSRAGIGIAAGARVWIEVPFDIKNPQCFGSDRTLIDVAVSSG